MLGHFLKSLEIGTTSLTDTELLPGTAVVGVDNIHELTKFGIVSKLQFGIVTDNNSVIYQLCLNTTKSKKITSDTIAKSRFPLIEESIGVFRKKYKEIYSYYLPDSSPAAEVLQRAKKQFESFKGGETAKELRSYPGDDFVDECLTGLTMNELMQKDKEAKYAGQHWSVPLKIDARLIASHLEARPEIQQLLQKEELNPTVYEATHHGIALEAGQMLHFTTCRTPDKKNFLKMDPQEEFHAISYNEKYGEMVVYPSESISERILSRNRAIWCMFHADRWGKYDILTNNCEHFSRFCREGKKNSPQVTIVAIKAIIAIAPFVIPKIGMIRGLGLIVATIVKNKKTKTTPLPKA